MLKQHAPRLELHLRVLLLLAHAQESLRPLPLQLCLSLPFSFPLSFPLARKFPLRTIPIMLLDVPQDLSLRERLL
jgi:hypothetical protein